MYPENILPGQYNRKNAYIYIKTFKVTIEYLWNVIILHNIISV